MAGYIDELYQDVDKLFDTMGKTQPFNYESSLPDPTAYEIRIQPVEPAGWVKNADGDDGEAYVTIDSRGLTILNGKIFLEDYAGSSVLGPAGFDGSWIDFLSNGVYNGAFNAGTLNSGSTSVTIVNDAETTDDYEASLSDDIPMWIIDNVTGTGTYEIRNYSGSVGRILRLSKGNGLAGQAGTGLVSIFQDVPVVGGHAQEFAIRMDLRPAEAVASEVVLKIFVTPMDSNHAALDVEELWKTFDLSSSLDFMTVPYVDGPTDPPDEARYMRLRFEVTFAATTSFHNADVRIANIKWRDQEYINGISLTPNNVPTTLNVVDQISSKTNELLLLASENAGGTRNIYLWGGPVRIRPTSGSAKIEFGDTSATFDVNLYRKSANQLGTDDAIVVTRSAVAEGVLAGMVSGDSEFRLLALAKGNIEWGSGSASRDVNLYRDSANVLATDDSLKLAHTDRQIKFVNGDATDILSRLEGGFATGRSWRTTSSSSTGIWHKIASGTIVQQFMYTYCDFMVREMNNSSADTAAAMIRIGVKQQASLGSNPSVICEAYDYRKWTPANDIVLVITQQDASATVWELWVETQSAPARFITIPILVEGQGAGSLVTMYHEGTSASLPPAGTGLGQTFATAV